MSSIYSLTVHAIPNSVLKKLPKIARNFLWGRSSNRSSFHSIGWNVTTIDKAEGGLSISNLKHVKTSLMAKNLFVVLNCDDKFWVDIFQTNYKDFSIWSSLNISKTSCLYTSLSNSIVDVRVNLVITCNPNLVNLWKDPWLYEIPIAFKPTYLNMHIPINWNRISNLKIEYHANNSWVWTPITSSTKLVNVNYNRLNLTSNSREHWEGWMFMWCLHVIPRVKFFLWKYFHGKLVTYACLYNLNIGPAENCTFSGLVLETAEYVIWSCNRSKICWDLVSAYAGVNLNQKFKFRIGDKGFKALIASCGWAICFL
ncbi:Reverse transcriptase zinc-binding domain-containing protein [Dioscorea alata]|uniref:Reverse transcriptase zinc-binding domain-containing protein n=1 Tax=Dioscorea alata TaxID=55571 RepID=A0ACB7U6T7_DIOAL|nr:Reverse transcriptase zinc-binding domain-containing protein [Dioscorea alata]